ncbi:hypothetical protein AKJ09_10854 [Labilithrix luteola]|uniref:Uncharacterized protein n=1 Tax=Labilithrix luteola TaxID=1391654 RepID=A0A0K1QEJ9_9BACT|nr:hypothetical protein AKJ09_10854 [Labilithrix luteola]
MPAFLKCTTCPFESHRGATSNAHAAPGEPGNCGRRPDERAGRGFAWIVREPFPVVTEALQARP